LNQTGTDLGIPNESRPQGFGIRGHDGCHPNMNSCI
jgi:hypothetical protein